MLANTARTAARVAAPALRRNVSTQTWSQAVREFTRNEKPQAHRPAPARAQSPRSAAAAAMHSWNQLRMDANKVHCDNVRSIIPPRVTVKGSAMPVGM